ncbi:MAG: VCBS repeat-containing protein, partial [Acidobacteriota bacterium]
GDGDNDFFACDGATGDVSLYTQGPANVFVPTTVATGVTSAGGFLCTYLRTADFNGDGQTDFVVGDHMFAGGVHIYIQSSGTFAKITPGLDLSWASPTGAQCNCLFALAAGDVNGDGNDDVLVLGFAGVGAGQVWMYEGNGLTVTNPPTQKFTVTTSFPVVANPTGLALFDVDGDGDLDLVIGGSFDGSHYIYTNDGVGNFIAPPSSAFTTNNYSGIDAFDADGDHDADLMLVDWSSERLLLSQNVNGVMAAPVAVGVVEGPSLGVGAPPLPDIVDFKLDHFKCYPAEPNQSVLDQVELTDQFNSGDAAVLRTRRFCNAVAKLHNEKWTPIMDEDAHLEMIEIEAGGKTPEQVEVTNQFGPGQKLEIGRAAFLAVPTKKIRPGDHPFPEGLDHFKCYEVDGVSEDVIVGLRDQFGFERELLAVNPTLLCNPTQKLHGGQETPIVNPLDHLVCYDLFNTRPLIPSAFIGNQFGERELRLDKADKLCLPSKKRVIK